MWENSASRSSIACASVLIALLYVPTLWMPFDFSDDGAIVYPTSASNPAKLLSHVGATTVEEFYTKGPFRPVAWLHWNAAAQIVGDNPLVRRIARLALAAVTIFCFLTFFAEIGLSGWPAWLAAALAFWNAYRGEIWMRLGLTEAFGMPYALIALLAARRAARSSGFNRWDIAALALALWAIGIKNTFAAIVPAQMYLRVARSDRSPIAAFLERPWPALVLAINLLWPVIQLAWVKLDGIPRGYQVQGLRAQFFVSFTRGLTDAVHLPWMAPAFVLVILGLIAARWSRPAGPKTEIFGPDVGMRLMTAALLTLFGVLFYVPVGVVSGRYTVPAAWGIDIAMAVGLDGLLRATPVMWRRVALATFAAGLLGCCYANLARQERFRLRDEMLWDAIAYIEKNAKPAETVVFVGKPIDNVRSGDLAEPEGLHLRWHFFKRSRPDLQIEIARDIPDATSPAHWVISGTMDQPDPVWDLRRHIEVAPFVRRDSAACNVWSKRDLSAAAPRADSPTTGRSQPR